MNSRSILLYPGSLSIVEAGTMAKVASITQKFVHERSFLDPDYYSDFFHSYFFDIILYIGRLILDMDIDRLLKIIHEEEHCCSHNTSLKHCKYYSDESLYELLFKSRSKSLIGKLDKVLEGHDYVRMEGHF